MTEKIAATFRWASMIFGLLIIGACTTAGGLEGGVFGALGGLLGGTIVVAIALGWLYTYFLLRRDLKSIEAEIAKLRGGAREEP